MNTFLNLQQEIGSIPVDKHLQAISRIPLIKRIYIRGLSEQYKLRFLPGYYGDQTKRSSSCFNGLNYQAFQNLIIHAIES